ncbi:hypothetical protein SAMN05661012_05846 [Chitinophaga sancti]|uniref:Uncharacterized protein n=1 Tax=Chitinophaga sancti TaxID=1004 RepID=A0A1K1SP01_9BACT|nr:hypothetical protein SAMN05661012_05846 [Chitinophaga sancti]
MFPYRIKGTYAEFYGYVPLTVKVGDTVELDADKRRMNIYDSHYGLRVTYVLINTDDEDWEFVRRHTMFK